MKMRRFAVSVLAAAAVIAGTAGCSDSSSDSDAGSGSGSGGASSSPTPEAPATLTKDNFAQEVTAAQAEANSAHVDATVAVQGQEFTIVGDMTGFGTPDHLQMQITAEIGGQGLEMRAIDKVIFIKSPQLAQNGKEWVKIDGSDPNNPLSQIFDSANPGNFTAYLEGVTALEDNGAETVDGVETRHYTLTVDTADMLQSNPMFKGQDVSSLGLPKKLTSEVNLDSENRPVRIQTNLGTSGSFEANFSDYGKEVSVEAPDPSTVGEFSL
ncbi:MAG: LppX_LprAFG lipoprotein [Nocardioidaceae bacterium]|nr:LppX_LprAFG lipoprotein [Nocardioidaceae bacterium]